MGIIEIKQGGAVVAVVRETDIVAYVEQALRLTLRMGRVVTWVESAAALQELVRRGTIEAGDIAPLDAGVIDAVAAELRTHDYGVARRARIDPRLSPIIQGAATAAADRSRNG